MSKCNSDDLLKVFSELNISLSNSDKNNIRAWFDTDDEDLKNMLDWMCTNLSKDNYISPLEYAEFLKIKAPLNGDKYEREVKKTNEQYPGIFDGDKLASEIEVLEDKLELAVEEEKHLDDLIKINENLQKELAKELEDISTEQIKTNLLLKSTQELCESLGEKLDETNVKIHQQLVKYSSNLYNFKHGYASNFINNMDAQELRDNFNDTTSVLIPSLDKFSAKNVINTLTTVDNCTVNLSNPVENNLDTMESRLLNSQRNYVIAKIETEKARQTLDYLNNVDVSTLPLLKEDAYDQMRREEKLEQKHGLCGLMDEGLKRWAEEQVAQMRLKYARTELDEYRSKLENLNTLEDSALKLLAQYLLLDMLYEREKNDIDSSNQFLRKILDHTRRDLRDVTLRTETMRKMVGEQAEFDTKNVERKFKLIESVAGVLTNGQETDLAKSLDIIWEFKNELDTLQVKLFTTDFNRHEETVKEMQENVTILRSFLVCGPTCRIIVVPPELQAIFAIMEENLRKRDASVRNAVKTYVSKKTTDKWANYRRLLWTYFYTDPEKMFSILNEVKEESKKKRRAREML